MLSEMAGPRISISDPIDRSVDGIGDVALEIEDLLTRGKDRIFQLVQFTG
jgi:hypothetical protein